MTKNPKIKAPEIDLVNDCSDEERETILRVMQRKAAVIGATKAAAVVIPDEFIEKRFGKQRAASVWLFVAGGILPGNLQGRIGLQIAAATYDKLGFANLTQAEILKLSGTTPRRGNSELASLGSTGRFRRKKVDREWRHQFVFDVPHYPEPLHPSHKGKTLPEPPPRQRHLIETKRRHVRSAFFQVARTVTGQMRERLSWNETMVILAIAVLNPDNNTEQQIPIAEIQKVVPRDEKDIRDALLGLSIKRLIIREASYVGPWRGPDKIAIILPAVIALGVINPPAEAQQIRSGVNVAEPPGRLSATDNFLGDISPGPIKEVSTGETAKFYRDVEENSSTVSAPTLPTECAAPGALRRTELVGSVGAHAAATEWVAAKGLGAQKGDVHPASAHQASHDQPGDEVGYPERGNDDRTTSPRPGYQTSHDTPNPAATSRAKPDPVTTSAAASNGAPD